MSGRRLGSRSLLPDDGENLVLDGFFEGSNGCLSGFFQHFRVAVLQMDETKLALEFTPLP